MTEERAQNNMLALRPYEDRSVGRPPDPDLSAMTKEEIEARRDTVRKLNELVKKAEKGTKKAVPEIRQILKQSPDLAWRFMDYGKLAEWHFIERMSTDKDFASKEVLKRQLAAMREEIAGENPSPLERLLAERIVITWLQINLYEGLYASGMFTSMTIAQGNYYQKRLDWTYRRHLSTIRTLAQVRKLLKPTVAQITSQGSRSTLRASEALHQNYSYEYAKGSAMRMQMRMLRARVSSPREGEGAARVP